MVAALLAAGALAGAVTDPTPQDPVGKTAGAIAAASGHNGLAGYLSEAELTSHLSSIKSLAVEEDEKAVESISKRSALLQVAETEDELSLKDSLAAVRNAAQAAARIQAAFRFHSFKKRQQEVAKNRDEYGLTSEEIHSLTSSTKIQRTPLYSYHDQKFDRAALSIQKNYRGWKGHKVFQTLRQRAMNIQVIELENFNLITLCLCHLIYILRAQSAFSLIWMSCIGSSAMHSVFLCFNLYLMSLFQIGRTCSHL